jgi:hypothetical protein
MNIAQRRHNISANATRIGDRGILPYPNAIVDTAPQVFGEVPVNMTIDSRAIPISVNRESVHNVNPFYNQGPLFETARYSHVMPKRSSIAMWMQWSPMGALARQLTSCSRIVQPDYLVQV